MRAAQIAIVLSGFILAATVGAAQFPVGPPVTWSVAVGGNGNAYQAFLAPGPILWTSANSLAGSVGGYLATITSAAENAFVYSVIAGAPALWPANTVGGLTGPWIGGVNGGAGFGWVTAEPFGYTNWLPGEPNNGCIGIPLEDHIHFCSSGAAPSAFWNDLANGGCPGGLMFPVGYVVEYSNDFCTTATAIAEGTVVADTNVGATTGPEPVGTCAAAVEDVWFSFVALCPGVYMASTSFAATSFDTVVTVFGGTCGALTQLACDDDAGAGLTSIALFTAVAGTTYYVSVGSFTGANGPFSLLVGPAGPGGAGMTLSFISAGPGTGGYAITAGPPFGTAFTALTTNAGAFPFGWFYGIDIPLPDLGAQIGAGYPFMVALDSCGSATVGPFLGLPPGLTLYGVSLGLPALTVVPTMATAPITGTVP